MIIGECGCIIELVMHMKSNVNVERIVYTSPTKMPNMDSHEKHELYYLERGKAKYFIENEIYQLEAGDMVFVPKGTFHRNNSEDGKGGVERLLFVFGDSFLGPDAEKYIEEMAQYKHIRVNKETLHKFKEIFAKIETEDKKRDPDYRELERLYLMELLILISRHRIKDAPTTLKPTHHIIQDAAKYISENYASELTLQSLSEIYAMSPGHFSKQFKKITGVGLNEYINIARISAAEQMLAKTNMPISAIARECGFNDSNYFAAVFKRLKGITPKKFSMISVKS